MEAFGTEQLLVIMVSRRAFKDRVALVRDPAEFMIESHSIN